MKGMVIVKLPPAKLLPFPWKIAPNKFPPKLGLG